MAEPPHPQRGMAADNGSAETLPSHNAGTNGSIPEHAALARREYGLLVTAGTEVDLADVEDPDSKAGHGGTGEKDRREPEKDGYKTQQRALPARGSNVIVDKGRGTPELSHELNSGGRQGG